MSGLYVKLDAEYASDDKLILAGPHAELLYIRGLAFCKRQFVDGVIHANQLPAVGLGIPNCKRHAAKLVEVGAWEETNTGWRIVAWLKRNKSRAEIEGEREMRRLASVEANHAQHHVGEGKKPSPRCEICRSEKHTKPDPKTAPISDPPTLPNRLQESESEPEPEEEPEGEGKPEGESESGPSQHRFKTTVDTVVDRLTELFPTNGTNPKHHRAAIKADVLAKHGCHLHDLIRRYPDAQPVTLAADIIREMT